MRKKTTAFLLVLWIICLIPLSSCAGLEERGVGIVRTLDLPVYGWRGHLLLQSGREMVMLTPTGETISLGDADTVANHGGVFVCENGEDGHGFFVRNGYHSGAWVDGTRFYDGYAGEGIQLAPSHATLFPQTVNEDAAQSYEPERMGYVNRQRIWVLPPQYLHGDYEVEQFDDGVAVPTDWTSGKTLFLSDDGQSTPFCIQGAIPCSGKFCDGLLRVIVWENNSGMNGDGGPQKRYRFVTRDNRPLRGGNRYRNARDFSEGLAAVQRNRLWGFIDTSGETVIDFQYEVAGDFHNGRAAVSDPEGNIFYINPKGTAVSEPISGYTFSGEAQGGFFKAVLPSGNSVLVDEQGKVVSERPADYQWEDGYWSAFLDGEIGAQVLVLQNGVNLYSDYFFRVFGNVCVGTTKDKDVLYNMETGEVLRTASSIRNFREGLAFCRDTFVSGYIDKKGQWVIMSPALSPVRTEGMWDEDNQFHGGLACVRYNNENVLLYNPLIYPDGWAKDEFERALSLGFGEETLGEENLTPQVLISLVDDFQSFVDDHQEDGVFLTADFRDPVT